MSHDDASPIEQPFSFTVTRDQKVFIRWQGRIVTTLNGPRAEKFLASAGEADAAALQLLLARVTGNFKRGNERRGQ